MLVYDSLYAWCREAQTETHGWYPEKLRDRATRDGDARATVEIGAPPRRRRRAPKRSATG